MTFDRLKQMPDDLQDVRSAIAEVKIALGERRSTTEVKFDPNQPRAPEGTSTGGQWIRAGGGSAQRTRPQTPSPRTPSPPPKARQQARLPKTLGIIPSTASRTSLPLIAGAVGIQRAAGTYAAEVSGQSKTPFLHIPYVTPAIGNQPRSTATSRPNRPTVLLTPRHYEDDDCDELLDRELAFCRKASFRFSKSRSDLNAIRSTCYASARQRYAERLHKGGVSGIRTPLYTGQNYTGDGQ
jgi:hypothetical protein